MPSLPRQPKLNAPPKSLGQYRPGVGDLLMQMEHYMCLSLFPADDWAEIAVLRCDGAAATWASSVTGGVQG